MTFLSIIQMIASVGSTPTGPTGRSQETRLGRRTGGKIHLVGRSGRRDGPSSPKESLAGGARERNAGDFRS